MYGHFQWISVSYCFESEAAAQIGGSSRAENCSYFELPGNIANVGLPEMDISADELQGDVSPLHNIPSLTNPRALS
jgi:hypothetical protein